MDPNLLSEDELQALLQEEAPENDEETLTVPSLQPPDEFHRAEGLAEVAELKEVVRQLQIRMEFLEQLLQGHIKEADVGGRGMGTADSIGQTRRSGGTPMPSSKASVSDGKPLVGLPSRKIRHSRRGG